MLISINFRKRIAPAQFKRERYARGELSFKLTESLSTFYPRNGETEKEREKEKRGKLSREQTSLSLSLSLRLFLQRKTTCLANEQTMATVLLLSLFLSFARLSRLMSFHVTYI